MTFDALIITAGGFTVLKKITDTLTFKDCIYCFIAEIYILLATLELNIFLNFKRRDQHELHLKFLSIYLENIFLK